MNPKQCLLHAERLFNDLFTEQADFNLFQQRMMDYVEWRRSGKSEPDIDGRPGDVYHAQLKMRYATFAGSMMADYLEDVDCERFAKTTH